jgi:hypothetical protein
MSFGNLRADANIPTKNNRLSISIVPRQQMATQGDVGDMALREMAAVRWERLHKPQ